MWRDPVLRHWHWLNLRRKLVAASPLGKVRPGDDAIMGAALYIAARGKSDEEGAALGLRQCLSGAEQAVGLSGMNREGSTLRQQQLAIALSCAWLAARRGNRPEQWRLAAIARALLAALAAVTLPGGLPEIGDRPQPAPTAELLAALDEEERALFDALAQQARIDDLEILRQDGWLRRDDGLWSGLWHSPPSGWPVKGGLAHQDLGAGEIHWRGLPLLVDPGSPPAGDRAQARLYRSAAVHSGISLNGEDPYPYDREIYSESFRRAVAGPPPLLRCAPDGVQVIFDGYARLGGHREIQRLWRFTDDALVIDDLVLGTGRPSIERRLITPWQVSPAETGVRLEQDGHRMRLTGDLTPKIFPARRWTAEGREQKLTMILFEAATNLPWRGHLRLSLE